LISNKKIFLISVFVIVFCLTIKTFGMKAASMRGAENNIQVQILYDNTVYTEGTESDWGFSCLVTGSEKTILFDTGTQGKILWHNIHFLDVDINEVDLIVLSHIHRDHTGGLVSVLEKVKQVLVYIPSSFPDSFVETIEENGSTAVRVSESMEICPNVLLTGEMGTSIKEQSLIIKTDQGGVLITGCAHPGIVDIVERAKKVLGEEIYFAFGGFHLMSKSESQVHQIIERFNELGVTMCGATHCTGDKAISLFKEAYGKNYVAMGVGRIITLR
jgi:7,8-dihydropterin-6-yl-methyl-4-(beta-D-ribofuranosyl)aminobenzene 5'-phosphate synthase